MSAQFVGNLDPSRVARAFKLYKKLANLEHRLTEQRQNGRWGIGVNDDPLAIAYQQRVAWRQEVIDAYLSGRDPNPYVKRWYRAPESVSEAPEDART